MWFWLFWISYPYITSWPLKFTNILGPSKVTGQKDGTLDAVQRLFSNNESTVVI